MELFHDLQGDGLFSLGEVGVDGGVPVVPAPAVDGLLREGKGVLIGAVHRDDGGAEDHKLGHLSLGGPGGHEDVGAEACGGRVPGQRGGGVAGGGAGDGIRPRLPGLDHRHGGGTVLQGGGGILAVILEVEGPQPKRAGQPVGPVKGGPAHPQGRGRRAVLHRKEGTVAPHGIIPASVQVCGGKVGPDGLVIVLDVQDAAAAAGGEGGDGLVDGAAADTAGVTDIFHIAALYRLFSTPVASLKASMSPSSSSAWAWTPFQVFSSSYHRSFSSSTVRPCCSTQV